MFSEEKNEEYEPGRSRDFRKYSMDAALTAFA
jgi:hypothetical protein